MTIPTGAALKAARTILRLLTLPISIRAALKAVRTILRLLAIPISIRTTLEATRTILPLLPLSGRTLTIELATPVRTMLPVAVKGPIILAVTGHRPTEVLLLSVE